MCVSWLIARVTDCTPVVSSNHNALVCPCSSVPPPTAPTVLLAAWSILALLPPSLSFSGHRRYYLPIELQRFPVVQHRRDLLAHIGVAIHILLFGFLAISLRDITTSDHTICEIICARWCKAVLSYLHSMIIITELVTR